MSDADPPDPPPRKPFQFGLKRLMLITALASVVFATLAGLLRSSSEARMPPGFFVLMAIAAPMALMIGISLFQNVSDRIRRRK